MTNPIQPDADRALRAMRKIKELQAEIAEREELVTDLKDIVAANLPTGETVLDNLKAVVYQSRQFSEKFGKANAPELWDKHAETARVLTSERAKKVLSADEYALFQRPSAKLSVKVEVVDND